VDRFYGRGYGFGIRLRPAKTAREPVKKIFDLLAGDRLVLLLILGGIGRIRIVFGHGNLIVIVAIVGEFAR